MLRLVGSCVIRTREDLSQAMVACRECQEYTSTEGLGFWERAKAWADKHVCKNQEEK